jgi:hypothetical protein
MKTLGRQLAAAAKHVVESWITWVVVGAAAGTGMLFSTGLVASDTDQTEAPSGIAIEKAVAQAEAQANAARDATAEQK